MKERIKGFMGRTGTLPKAGEMSKEELVESLKPLVKYLREEVDELEDSLMNGDIVEATDAIDDILYFAIQGEIKLEAAGVDVLKSQELICNNNDEKYSTSYDFIEAKYLEWTETDPWLANKLYIDGNNYEGLTWFCLKDKETQKVKKFVDFDKVDLSGCIPKEFL